MMIQIPGVLSKPEAANCRALIEAAEWTDGNVTSGPQAALAKKNRQLPEDSSAARKGGELILDALGHNGLFFSAALPRKIWPPLFNRYSRGDTFGLHVDNAVRIGKAQDMRLRSDISATLFLSEPEDYDGGALTIEDTYGAHEVKLGAGDLILYPASSLHHVTPITRGERLASFFWIESMVREDARRTLLFDMDVAIQRLTQELGGAHPSVIALTGSYHNLLRMWAEA